MKLHNLATPDDPDIKASVRRLIDDANPLVARKGWMLLELVGYLETRGPVPSVFAYLFGDELWLTPVNRYNRAQVQVAVVWRDYGPVRDGYPDMYYRLSIKRAGASTSREERMSGLSEVERSIHEAFGWATRETGDPG